MVNTLASPGASDWKKMKVPELRDELASRGLETTGLKAALIERLEASDPKVVDDGEGLEEGEAKKDMEIDMNEEVALDDSLEKIDLGKPLLGKPAVESGAEAGTEPGADAEPVAVIVDAANGATEEASLAPSETALQEGNGKPLNSDLEKKQKRAERFGLELMVSEKEKRRLRAARFGDSPANGTEKSSEKPFVKPGTAIQQEASKMSPTVKEAEAVKRKARAARFGIEEVAGKPVGIDDAKKKARLERFGLAVKLDPKEQEKKRLRAARFGLDTPAEAKVEATNKVVVEPPAAG